ncbi:L,D-transpeptidase family protein [Selenihalanaerobacter shriftii]|uniref:Putative peptidoglycan binding domain-containing protein n=1 Tax=Selenihalanaerobacter shriftii TaxID=142842 RepID=A0A1T4LQX7_9FIRM|nr:peptidoglycan-binding protein [Selenihalanaerobacter shriftii]SJZ56918.1 Putative peptidoglycan binding domain-containing protein [Selenihalanaerobacter shriftii]
MILIIIFGCTLTIFAIESGPTCDCGQLRILGLKQSRMQGQDVQELQRQLKELGFYKRELNLVYDWNTYLAVNKFQKANNLTIDGIVDEKTWLNLAQALDKGKSQEVASEKLKPPEGEVFLLIDAYKKQMTVYSDGEPYHKFPVAVGKPSTKSPIGEWAVIAKDAHWGGGFGVRWMRLNVPWGIYGMHGTNKPGSIGTAASHGCIRMFNRHVKILYSWVDVGTRVKIIGRRDPIKITHNLRSGQSGKDVLLFQEKLREHGLDPGYTDGRFGDSTKKAMKDFKYIYGLKDDLVGDENTFYILNIK